MPGLSQLSRREVEDRLIGIIKETDTENVRLRKQLRRLLNLVDLGRPADPRDNDRWDREVLRAENLLKEDV